jgi:hypothetical protein
MVGDLARTLAKWGATRRKLNVYNRLIVLGLIAGFIASKIVTSKARA